MSSKGYRSLAGKARRTHQQNRFQKWINQEWMEETTSHAPSSPGTDRYIPVNYGSTLLKTVEFSAPETAVRPSIVGKSTTVTTATPSKSVSTGTRAAEAIIPSRRAAACAEPVVEEGGFSFGRFLAGCLLGGSAAAAILAVLYIIIV